MGDCLVCSRGIVFYSSTNNKMDLLYNKKEIVMAHLIDKDALVAWAKETYLCENASMIRKVCYKQLLEHLDTLEVKEVDLEKKFYDFLDLVIGKDNGHLSEDELFSIAKYFFELGLKAQKGE